jgi:hypothetical protein
MKKTTILLLVMITGLFINSCNKSTVETVSPEETSLIQNSGLNSNEEYRQALYSTIKDYTNQSQGNRGAEFPPVFFTEQGFYVIDETGMKLATFETELDGNDFLRENPDGTVTVHIVSDNATSALFDYMTYDYYSGINGHMIMNYSGPALMIPVPDGEGNIIGYIYNIIYPNNVSPATVWHGHGPVQLFGMGPELNLVAKLTASAKWKNVKTVVRLD